MKLEINGEVLRFSKKDDKFVSLISQMVDDLFKKYGTNNSLILEWNPKFISYAKNERDQRIKQFPTQKAISLQNEYSSSHTVKEGLGHISVRLYETYKMRGDEKIFLPRNFPFKGRLILNRNDMEQIFFMIFVSPRCQKLDDPQLASHQIATKTNVEPWYFIYNENRKAKEQIESTALKAKLEYLITTNDEGVKLSALDATTLATIFGWTYTGKPDETLAKSFLLNKLNKGIEHVRELNEYFQNPERIRLNALIEKSKLSKLIGLVKEDGGKGQKWAYLNRDGEATDLIIKVPSNQDASKVLYNFLAKNSDAAKRLETEASL